MKKGLHPDYKVATVTCASCGATWTTHSTRDTIRVDICGNCHPFYTGRQTIVDTEGRVERFRNKYKQAAEARQGKP